LLGLVRPFNLKKIIYGSTTGYAGKSGHKKIMKIEGENKKEQKRTEKNKSWLGKPAGRQWGQKTRTIH
jgi:hypothetical protein